MTSELWQRVNEILLHTVAISLRLPPSKLQERKRLPPSLTMPMTPMAASKRRGAFRRFVCCGNRPRWDGIRIPGGREDGEYRALSHMT